MSSSSVSSLSNDSSENDSDTENIKVKRNIEAHRYTNVGPKKAFFHRRRGRRGRMPKNMVSYTEERSPKGDNVETKSPSTPVGITKPLKDDTFDWKTYLKDANFVAAPVSCFKHVSLADSWNNITPDMKVEIINSDCKNYNGILPVFYWVASVIRISGYMTLLRYEGFGSDSSFDFWVNICMDDVHPVGWCSSKGKPLIPPKSIEDKYPDWKQFLVKRLIGARTLPSDFPEKIEESLNNTIKKATKLEVVDKNRISAVRVATVTAVIGGRLHVTYDGCEGEDQGFWCHERSPLIHPIGWAQVIGHDLKGLTDYAKLSLHKTLFREFEDNDATWDMFLPVSNPVTDLKFKVGMKLEAIDPLNLSTICVATVTKVLRNNYLMIGIDGMMAANGSDWFCYHASSSCIFPVGFCSENNITLTPPRGYKGEFRWEEYLKQTKSTAAPVGLFKKDIPCHGFKEGMHLEAVDLMEPGLICVGSVTNVVGRLLRIHFDGWENAYDQWCDCESPDLFPVGWCQLVGYRLEPPRTENPDDTFKKKKKYVIYKGQRKKRRGGYFRKTQSLAETKDQRFKDKDQSDDPSSSDNSPSKSREDSNSSEKVLDSDVKSVDSTSRLLAGCSPKIPSKDVNPKNWSVADVAQYLRMNECGAYSQIFIHEKIDGAKFVKLTREGLLSMTGMKVGPSLKISHLIQMLHAHKI